MNERTQLVIVGILSFTCLYGRMIWDYRQLMKRKGKLK